MNNGNFSDNAPDFRRTLFFSSWEFNVGIILIWLERVSLFSLNFFTDLDHYLTME